MSGLISLAKPLDRERQQSFNLTLKAADLGKEKDEEKAEGEEEEEEREEEEEEEGDEKGKGERGGDGASRRTMIAPHPRTDLTPFQYSLH